MAAEGAHPVAVGGRWHVIRELGVALLVAEASDVEASSPSERFADQREVVRGQGGPAQALVEDCVTANGGKVTACTACHGLDLRGLGPVPRLAARSPSYILRANSTTCSTVTVWELGLLSWLRSSPTLAEDLLTASAYLASLEP